MSSLIIINGKLRTETTELVVGETATGVCCCDQCSCDGFDLEEAYNSQCVNFPESYDGDGDGALIFGPYGNCSAGPPADPDCPNRTWSRRLSCLRFLCCCYKSTGEKAAGNSDTNSWYEVLPGCISAGGPTTNDRNLRGVLVAAAGPGGVPLEKHFVVTESGIVDLPAGRTGCVVWIFAFYGWMQTCRPAGDRPFKKHIPDDNCYLIGPCVRCP